MKSKKITRRGVIKSGVATSAALMRRLTAAITITAVTMAFWPTDTLAGPTVDSIKKRGRVICGVNGNRAGFSALVIFQIPALKSYGLTPSVAGSVVLIWGIGSIPGRIAGGYLADKFDKRLIFGGSIIVQMVGIGFLITADNFAEALPYALIHGAGWGATTPSRLALQGEYWGRSIFRRLMGLQMGLSAFGGILSPLSVGWMFDRYGTYDTAFVILFVPLALCFGLVVTMRRPKLAAA